MIAESHSHLRPLALFPSPHSAAVRRSSRIEQADGKFLNSPLADADRRSGTDFAFWSTYVSCPLSRDREQVSKHDQKDDVAIDAPDASASFSMTMRHNLTCKQSKKRCCS
ncbi:hypothetical protein E2P81_ATG07141 [Venturia nashicola]|nr:hypothetical protein E2P81_ATG07141 [Venturia nashicola]